MRNLVVPLCISLIILLGAGMARAELRPQDTLGFKDTVRALPGEYLTVGVYLNADSIVSGVSLIFEFDHDVLWPVIEFDQQFQDSLNAGVTMDSTQWQPTPTVDPGLWYIEYDLASYLANTTYGWVNTVTRPWATWGCFYNLNVRDTARILMAPNAILPDPGSDYVRPWIPATDDVPGKNIGFINFRVNPNATIGQTSILRVRGQSAQGQLSELAEEWFVAGENKTVGVIPTYRNSLFIVGTGTTVIGACCTGGSSCTPNLTQTQCDNIGGVWYEGQDCTSNPCGTAGNDPPTISINPSNSVYTIKVGEQVSFTVSSIDPDGDDIQLWANRSGGLPPNANFTPSNPALGSGTVSATFSFKPDANQEGNHAFTFQAFDASLSSSPLNVTVTVEELEEDRLFTTSADGLKSEGGIPGLTGVMVPVNVVTKKILYGVQFDMSYDPNMFELDSIITSDRIPDWVIYDNVGQTPGQVRVVTFGLSNDSMVAGSTSAILYCAFTVDDFAVPECYPLDLTDAWESIDPDPNVASLQMTAESGILCVDQVGDVNLDRRIDVADLVNVVAYIIGNFNLSRRQFATGDIVVNDTVNVIDLVGIINTIFGWPINPAPAPGFFDDGQYATLKVLNDEIPYANMLSEMSVQADLPVNAAGVEMEIRYNPTAVEMLKPAIDNSSSAFRIYSSDDGNGRMVVLIHSEHPWSENEQIKSGVSNIVRLPFVSRTPLTADAGQVWISDASVSTGEAQAVKVSGLGGGSAVPNKFILYQNRPNPFNPTTAIDFYIDGSAGDEKVRLEIFNILGQSIKTLVDESLPAGQHSVIWDGKDGNGSRVATGVYLYRLQIGGEGKTKKMVLLK